MQPQFTRVEGADIVMKSSASAQVQRRGLGDLLWKRIDAETACFQVKLRYETHR